MPLVQALRLCTGRTAHKGSRGIALLFLDHGTRRGERLASRPGRSLPQGKTRYPLHRRLGVPQGRSGQVRKISPPPGFDPRTIQPIVSRCTDYATRPTAKLMCRPNLLFSSQRSIYIYIYVHYSLYDYINTIDVTVLFSKNNTYCAVPTVLQHVWIQVFTD